MSPSTNSAVCAVRASLRRADRCAARSWLLAYLLAIVACLIAVEFGRSVNSFPRSLPAARGDIRLYWDVVHRLQSGEDYYPAMYAELQRQGYPTTSVFNWRTPSVLWLMARPAGPIDGPTIVFCAAVALILAGFVMQKKNLGTTWAYVGGLLMLGAVLPAFVTDVCLLPLLWAAVCVGLSLCCFEWNYTGLAVLFGTLAACFSELSLGYAVLMAASAVRSGDRRELTLWAAGLSTFGVCFLWHAGMVSRTIGSDEVVNARAWLQFCGLPFLVAASQMNCWLLPLPPWLAALYLPTALLGLAHWHSPAGHRCMVFVSAYCLLFLCAGQSFNQYWGLLLAPPLAWGAARGPKVLGDLWHSAQLSPRAAWSGYRSPQGR